MPKVAVVAPVDRLSFVQSTLSKIQDDDTIIFDSTNGTFIDHHKKTEQVIIPVRNTYIEMPKININQPMSGRQKRTLRRKKQRRKN